MCSHLGRYIRDLTRVEPHTAEIEACLRDENEGVQERAQELLLLMETRHGTHVLHMLVGTCSMRWSQR